jgi:hypothetical protein
MTSDLSFKTAICDQYEKLLVTCQKALESWKAKREEIATFGMRGKADANELLRLQADYAKAYSRLERHEDNCELCRFVSKIGGRNYASVSTAMLDKRRAN